MRRTASVTLLPSKQGDPSRRPDIMRTTQLTFSPKFVDAQNKMSAYQRSLDARLAVPKFTRSRVVNKKMKASLLQLN